MKKLLFILFALCLSSQAFGAVTDSTKVAANGDDGFVQAPYNTSFLSQNTSNGRKVIMIGRNSAGVAWVSYFRLAMPAGVESGATINSATLNVTCLGLKRGANATNLKVSVVDTLDAVSVTTAALLNNMWAKRDSVETPIDFDIATSDTLVRYSKDITALVQRALNAGCVGGKHLGIFVSADSTLTTRDIGIGSYEEGVDNYKTTLVLTYTNPSLAVNDGRNQKVHPKQNIIKGRRK